MWPTTYLKTPNTNEKIKKNVWPQARKKEENTAKERKKENTAKIKIYTTRRKQRKD